MDVHARCCSATLAAEAEESVMGLIANSRRCIIGIADSLAMVWMTFNTSGFRRNKENEIKKVLHFPIISFLIFRISIFIYCEDHASLNFITTASQMSELYCA